MAEGSKLPEWYDDLCALMMDIDGGYAMDFNGYRIAEFIQGLIAKAVAEKQIEKPLNLRDLNWCVPLFRELRVIYES